ncbi:hypothetical protein NUW58_g7185 [Xylaria curta]|uniref:Uncharacterized protein n=1 Tax=Xylaria curta TaxID=42375 RepID=A0ACC1NJJ4_9PEZI|nr:hypothetical protein NUW58_g7185 [Xylaria curta]
MEPEKYIIDPNGDAIIRLRDFNAPFAVLKEGEELYVPIKTTAPAATGGLFGFASSDSTAPIDPGNPFRSVFASFSGTSAPSSTGVRFGFASSGTTAPTSTDGLFGSSATKPTSTSSLFGTAPSGTTQPPSTDGLFGSASFRNTAPAGGLFGSASSSTTKPASTGGLFGSASSSNNTGASLFGRMSGTSSSGPTAPSGSGGLFSFASPSGTTPPSGSATPTGTPGPVDSTSSADSVSSSGSPGVTSSSEDVQQPKLPSDDAKHESSEISIHPEEQTEPSTKSPELRLQVSSAHLKLASRYFQKALGGEFREAQPNIDGLLCIDASHWDRKALIIVLQIIHGQNRQVPKTLDLEMLAKIAVIVDYYDCHEVFDAFAELWLHRLKGRLILLHKLDRELLFLLLVSWVFRWAYEFKLATKIILRHSKGPLLTLDLPIPEAITCKFSATTIALIAANEALRAVGSSLDRLTRNFQQERPPCSFECASMNLGALSRQTYNSKELRDISNIFRNFEGQSVASTMEAARAIRSPNWKCGGSRGVLCNLASLVKTAMDKLEDVDGFDLKNFV